MKRGPRPGPTRGGGVLPAFQGPRGEGRAFKAKWSTLVIGKVRLLHELQMTGYIEFVDFSHKLVAGGCSDLKSLVR